MTNSSLIAPCGMNCGICLGYLRDKNKCYGCRNDHLQKPEYCRRCIITNCDHLSKTESKFCYDCTKYPCRRIKQLDKRYRTNYNMSMIENLGFIKSRGLDEFMEKEKKLWVCTSCGAVRCVHRDSCLVCKHKHTM